MQDAGARLLPVDRVRRSGPVRLELAGDSGGVKPGLLAADQAVADVEDVQYPEAHRRAVAVDTHECAANVTGGDRLVDDVLTAGEPAHRLQVKIGNPVHDPLVDLGRGVLAVHGARRVADV